MAELPIVASIRINDGNTEVDYVNVFPLNTAPYKIMDEPTIGLSGQVPTPTVHDSDDGPPETINLEEQNRLWAFTLRVTATADQPNVSKNLSTLKRHIQGKQSTAYQAYRNGSQPDVIFRMQLSPSSPTTDFIIQQGSFQDNNSYYSTAALLDESTIGINVNLLCTPAGRGEVINLRNDFPSSPHVIENNTSANLADGWINNNASTTSMNPASWLTGGQSQEFVSTGVNSGVKIQVTTSILDANLVAYVWARTKIGTITISLRSNNFSNVIQSKALMVNDAGSVSDMERIDREGNTWYRVSFSGNNGSFTNQTGILAVSSTVADRGLIDNAYLEFDQTIIPSAFCSSSALKNRYDPSAGNEERINYLDVWNVLGGMPYSYKLNYQNNGIPYIGIRHTGNQISSDALILKDRSGWTLGGGWTNTADASVLGGGYLENTVPDSGIATTAISADDSFSTFGQPVRILVVLRASSTGIDFRLQSSITAAGGDPLLDETRSVADTGVYQLIDFGTLNASGALPPSSSEFTTITFAFSVTAGTGNARVVGIYFFPTDSFAIAPVTFGGDFRYESDLQSFYSISQKLGRIRGATGELVNTLPHKEHRFLFITEDAGGATPQYIPTETNQTSLEITPMASHLIGDA